MQSTLRPVLSGLAALFGFGLAAPAEGIEFRPEEGSSIEKTFLIESVFELDGLSAIVAGQDIAEFFGEVELRIEGETTIVVTDTYVAIEDGRPATLERVFETLESFLSIDYSAGAESGGSENESSSELEGLTVVFTAEDDGDEYSAEFADGAEDPGSLLEGLLEDLDLRFLLPDAEVSEGDSWAVDTREFEKILSPGGSLAFDDGADDEDFDGMDSMTDGLSDAFDEKIEELLDGSGECTFIGMREEDGRTLAEIEVTLEISSVIDVVEFLDDMKDELDGNVMPFPFQIDVADINIDVECEGTLLWDVAAGHFHSLRIASDGEFAVDLAFSFEAGGESQEAELSFEFVMSMKHDATAGE